MSDLQGIFQKAFDPVSNAFRITGTGEPVFLGPEAWRILTATPATVVTNDVESWEFDGTTTEAIISTFVVPPFFNLCNFRIYWGRRVAGSGNVRHRIRLKDLADNDLNSEAAVQDVSANVAVPVLNAITQRDHLTNIALNPGRLYSVIYERTAADAGDTFNALDSSFYGMDIRRAI